LRHPARHSGKTSNPHGKITKINPESKQSQIFGSTQVTTVSQHTSIASKSSAITYCAICKLKNTSMDKDHLVCTKLDHTSKELSKLYWDARRLME